MRELPLEYRKLFDAFMACEAKDFKKKKHPCTEEIWKFIEETRGCIHIRSFSNAGENIRDLGLVLPDADGKFKRLSVTLNLCTCGETWDAYNSFGHHIGGVKCGMTPLI